MWALAKLYVLLLAASPVSCAVPGHVLQCVITQWLPLVWRVERMVSTTAAHVALWLAELQPTCEAAQRADVSIQSALGQLVEQRKEVERVLGGGAAA